MDDKDKGLCVLLLRRGGDLCRDAADRIIYLSAQESLLEEWQQRAIKAEDALSNFPGHEQMRRLNAQIILLRACVLAADAMRDEWNDSDRVCKCYDDARAKVDV